MAKKKLQTVKAVKKAPLRRRLKVSDEYLKPYLKARQVLKKFGEEAELATFTLKMMELAFMALEADIRKEYKISRNKGFSIDSEGNLTVN